LKYNDNVRKVVPPRDNMSKRVSQGAGQSRDTFRTTRGARSACERRTDTYNGTRDTAGHFDLSHSRLYVGHFPPLYRAVGVPRPWFEEIETRRPRPPTRHIWKDLRDERASHHTSADPPPPAPPDRATPCHLYPPAGSADWRALQDAPYRRGSDHVGTLQCQPTERRLMLGTLGGGGCESLQRRDF
jgi:hypothetical protein